MKRIVYADSRSYSSVLKRIEADLLSEGKNAKINQAKKCVDVFDDNGFVVEQHYPELSGTSPGTRGKFVKVPQGQGNYILTRVNYTKKNYTHNDHLVKYVSKTNKDNR